MHFTTTLLLASSVALITAAPTPIKVNADDVILYGKGRFTMMKRSGLQELEAARNSGIAPPMPGSLDDTLYTILGNKTSTPVDQLKKRDGVTIIIPGADSRFLGWDTLMSPIVKGAPTQITVGSGYSISNSISVSVSADITLVKDFLSASASTDYSQSWTSSQTQQFSASVPAGKYGAFVSNAWTNRKTGNVWQGAIGGAGSLTHYQADSFASKGYGDLNWVDGVISLCTGDSFPLHMCLGSGTL